MNIWTSGLHDSTLPICLIELGIGDTSGSDRIRT